jgi:hypothetical protein
VRGVKESARFNGAVGDVVILFDLLWDEDNRIYI